MGHRNMLCRFLERLVLLFSCILVHSGINTFAVLCVGGGHRSFDEQIFSVKWVSAVSLRASVTTLCICRKYQTASCTVL